MFCVCRYNNEVYVGLWVCVCVSDVFKLFQWMIIDYKEFKPGQRVNNNTLWVLDQIPYANSMYLSGLLVGHSCL